MRSIEFACILQELQHKHELELDTYLVAEIYNHYEKSCNYDIAGRYNLFELIVFLDNSNIPITCKLNKESIIDIIISNRIELPMKEDASMNAIGRHLLYQPTPRSNRHDSYCITINNDLDKYIGSLIENDIIEINTRQYTITCIRCPITSFKTDIELYTIVIEDTETKEQITYNAKDFANLFKTNTVTIIYNKCRNLTLQNKRV